MKLLHIQKFSCCMKTTLLSLPAKSERLRNTDQRKHNHFETVLFHEIALHPYVQFLIHTLSITSKSFSMHTAEFHMLFGTGPKSTLLS